MATYIPHVAYASSFGNKWIIMSFKDSIIQTGSHISDRECMAV